MSVSMWIEAWDLLFYFLNSRHRDLHVTFPEEVAIENVFVIHSANAHIIKYADQNVFIRQYWQLMLTVYLLESELHKNLLNVVGNSHLETTAQQCVFAAFAVIRLSQITDMAVYKQAIQRMYVTITYVYKHKI